MMNLMRLNSFRIFCNINIILVIEIILQTTFGDQHLVRFLKKIKPEACWDLCAGVRLHVHVHTVKNISYVLKQ